MKYLLKIEKEKKMKKILLLLVTIMVMALLSACVRTQGNANINDRKITNKIKYGYTKNKVRDILGDPSSTMMLRNGEQWTYSYSEAKFNMGAHMLSVYGLSGGDTVTGHKNTIYTIKFNMSGRVTSKKYGY